MVAEEGEISRSRIINYVVSEETDYTRGVGIFIFYW
jgi:hypothetical protein